MDWEEGKNKITHVLPKHRQENYSLDNGGVRERMARIWSYFGDITNRICGWTECGVCSKRGVKNNCKAFHLGN